MIYGIGSMYGSDEMVPEFIRQRVACIGWPKTEAPGLHQMLRQMTVGDIIFIKAHPPSHGLYLKAVGVVDSPDTYESRDLGVGRYVRWVWHVTASVEAVHLGRLNDRYDHMRGGTLYPEFGPAVQEAVINILVRQNRN